ncbi:3-deoxy-manno-octulosonate cytidylyltransferase [Endothiovibrio diazotrophicus]
MSGAAEPLRFKVVIPARYGSSRLPGKPLAPIAGRPMIEHVHRRALESGAEEVWIATDDERIGEAARCFGARVCMTSAEHRSGTDRIGEVAAMRGWGEEEIVVNLQGDEPLMPPTLLRQAAAGLSDHPQAVVATLAARIHTTAELFDPHVVKVVSDAAGFACYFSRAPIPWDRDAFAVTTEELPERSAHFRHIGLYAYRAGYLARYAELEPCPLEAMESLEQLRVLWHGDSIYVAEAAELPGPGVDTAADLERIAALVAAPVAEQGT